MPMFLPKFDFKTSIHLSYILQIRETMNFANLTTDDTFPKYVFPSNLKSSMYFKKMSDKVCFVTKICEQNPNTPVREENPTCNVDPPCIKALHVPGSPPQLHKIYFHYLLTQQALIRASTVIGARMLNPEFKKVKDMVCALRLTIVEKLFSF